MPVKNRLNCSSLKKSFYRPPARLYAALRSRHIDIEPVKGVGRVGGRGGNDNTKLYT